VPLPEEDEPAAPTATARNLRRVFHGCKIMFYVVMPLTLLLMIGIGIL
jgi:hypothetical protein